MTDTFNPLGTPARFRGFARWRRALIVWGVIALVALVLVSSTWKAFFVYVRPGSHLVITAKDGQPLTPGHVLAEAGQKGIQREVLGEGWHFVLPIVYATEMEKNTDVPPGKVGIVTALGGKPLPPGRLLAETTANPQDEEQGIQRQVLPPGSYRINLRGYRVELVDATEIKPGFVGVQRRLLGIDGASRFAEQPNEKGILREVLQPGLYYINTKEFEVIHSEVGIFQTAFRYDKRPQENTAIDFTSKGGFPISMDCTVEWEILPADMPSLVAEYGSRQVVEKTVVDVQAHSIGRDKGIDYGVQDFLEGTKREKFQADFTQELIRVGRAKNVTVHSAFIRNIVIPEAYLKPIRDKQIAGETEITNKAKEITAQTEAEVEREQQMIQQRVVEVEAETKRLVASIDRDVENIGTKTTNEIDKLKAEFDAKIAALEGRRTQVLGGAEAQVTTLKETARSTIYQLKMDVFKNDADAFLRYSLSEQLNPNMVMRLFHSGAGTFWTNLEGKGVSLMLPAAGAAPAAAATPAAGRGNEAK
jgi:hypothetical protein